MPHRSVRCVGRAFWARCAARIRGVR
jgi:hypothetical protein